jgi:hypothetical protein
VKKSVLTVIVVFLVVIANAWHSRSRPGSTKSMVKDEVMVQPKLFYAPVEDFVAATDLRKYQVEQRNILKDDANLTIQYKKLRGAMEEQQQALNEALIAADPKVVAAMVKMQAMHKAENQSPSSGSVPAARGAPLTVEDLKEIQAARQMALQKHPDFARKSVALAQKMTALQETLDAEMIKHDPSTAAVISRLKARPAPLVADRSSGP